MTIPEDAIETKQDFWVCNPSSQIQNRVPHEWMYPRRGIYRCRRCQLVVTKAQMKAGTDA